MLLDNVLPKNADSPPANRHSPRTGEGVPKAIDAGWRPEPQIDCYLQFSIDGWCSPSVEEPGVCGGRKARV